VCFQRLPTYDSERGVGIQASCRKERPSVPHLDGAPDRKHDPSDETGGECAKQERSTTLVPVREMGDNDHGNHGGRECLNKRVIKKQSVCVCVNLQGFVEAYRNGHELGSGAFVSQPLNDGRKENAQAKKRCRVTVCVRGVRPSDHPLPEYYRLKETHQ
jgi:hypothetical protein